MAGSLELPQFDQVWLMPSGDRLDKHIGGATDQDRLAMLRLVAQHRFLGDPRLMVSDFELNLPRPSSTYQTFHALQRAYPTTRFSFAYGADAYASMPSWPHGQELQKILPVVLFGQKAVRLPGGEQVLPLPLPGPLQDLSSTAARQAVKRGERPDSVLSTPVLGYVASHQLYR